MMFGQLLSIHRIFKRAAKALIRLRLCTGWSEPLMVAHTTLLEISCHGSYVKFDQNIHVVQEVRASSLTANERTDGHTDGLAVNKVYAYRSSNYPFIGGLYVIYQKVI